MLRRLAASFEATDSGGRTPLLTAVWNGHIEMSAYLLETVGVNPNSVDEQVSSPFILQEWSSIFILFSSAKKLPI